MKKEFDQVICHTIVPRLLNTIRQAAFDVAGPDPFSQEATQQALLDALVDFLTCGNSADDIIDISQLNQQNAANYLQIKSIARYKDARGPKKARKRA